MDDSLVRIGKLAALSGVTVRTLHYYEQKGLIEPLCRQPNGYRYYDPTLEMPIRVFGAALSLGLSLAEIGDIFALIKPLKCKPSLDEERICMPRVCDVYRRHIARLSEAIGKLEGERAGLEGRLEYCLNELRGSVNPRIGVPTSRRRRRVPGRVEYVHD